MADSVSDDQTNFEMLNPGSLIFGMGVGTFLVFFFFLTIGFIWFFSSACLPLEKTLWRGISVCLFIIVFVILMYAPRQSKYTNGGYVPSTYDYSIIPRIAISLIMMIFGIVASALLVDLYAAPIELNNVEQEYTALWQEEH